MVNKEIPRKALSRLKETFLNALFTVHSSMTPKLLEKYIDLITQIGKAPAAFVINIVIKPEQVVLILDERFDLNCITSFQNESLWTFNLHHETLYKGYTLNRSRPVVMVLVPIVWVPEKHT